MKRCVVVSAGEIRNYERAKDLVCKDDFFIFCDGGLCHAEKLCVKPSVIVGDFDSCPEKELHRYENACIDAKIIRLPREKDDTDTFYAVKYALSLGYDDFLFLGAMGARFDHAFGNISILSYLYDRGINAVLADDYSVMRVAGSKPVFIEDKCRYFSVLTVSGDVSGVTIKNAKYPLNNENLSCDFQLGISNQVLPGKTAEVFVSKGKVLVVEIFEG